MLLCQHRQQTLSPPGSFVAFQRIDPALQPQSSRKGVLDMPPAWLVFVLQRFFCWGHCVTGPSWKSGMGSLALLIAPTVVFLVFVVPYMSRNLSPVFWIVRCGCCKISTTQQQSGISNSNSKRNVHCAAPSVLGARALSSQQLCINAEEALSAKEVMLCICQLHSQTGTAVTLHMAWLDSQQLCSCRRPH